MSIEKISLSGRKTEVVDKNMTFAEKIYFPAVIKGLIITIKHFFKKNSYDDRNSTSIQTFNIGTN